MSETTPEKKGSFSTPGRKKSISGDELESVLKATAVRNELTDEQTKVFLQVAKKVQTSFPFHHFKPLVLLRFTRARKFNIEETVKQYEENIRWRAQNDIDGILANPPTESRKFIGNFVPESFHKHDLHDQPAYFIKAGKCRSKELMQNVTLEEFTKSHIWGMEFSFQKSSEMESKTGKPIQFVNIVDLAGMSLSHRKMMKYIKEVSKLDQKFYPESMGKTFVINAPWIFPVMWKLISPLIDPHTRSKITVLGSNYQEVLKKNFSPESLPKEYGGACTCNQPRSCCYEATEAEMLQAIAEEEKKYTWTETTLAAGKNVEVSLPCAQFGAIYTFIFKTVKDDIGFAATFKPENKVPEKIDWQKLEKFPGKNAVKGSFSSDTNGVAVFEFSNKHAWFGTKTLLYNITVTNFKEKRVAPRSSVDLDGPEDEEVDEKEAKEGAADFSKMSLAE